MGCGGHSLFPRIPTGGCGSDNTAEHEQPRIHAEPPLEILKKRYARGEINKEEFDQMKKDLTGGGESTPERVASSGQGRKTRPTTVAPEVQRTQISYRQAREDVLALTASRGYSPLLLGMAIVGIIFVAILGLLVNPLGWILIPLILLGCAALVYIAYAIWRATSSSRKSVLGRTVDLSQLETDAGTLQWDETRALELKLEAGFNEIKMDQGMSVFRDLKGEYDALKQIYLGDSFTDASLINTAKMKETIVKVYRKALDLLTTVLDLSRQVSTIDISHLEQKNREIEQEIKAKEAQNLPVLALKDKLDRNIENITAARTTCGKVDGLLHQVNLCERLLRKARFEIPELIVHRPREDFDQMIAELEGRIGLAQKLKEEYDKQGI
ncbi:MAG: hypothetical protein A2144_03130 [Chloroflexi bacterium RBG_16_50_9]|nr:MAG: hypothetical protein A2144_03130 [Chloroflexi bacterium RBG_16_50_9]